MKNIIFNHEQVLKRRVIGGIISLEKPNEGVGVSTRNPEDEVNSSQTNITNAQYLYENLVYISFSTSATLDTLVGLLDNEYVSYGLKCLTEDTNEYQ